MHTYDLERCCLISLVHLSNGLIHLLVAGLAGEAVVAYKETALPTALSFYWHRLCLTEDGLVLFRRLGEHRFRVLDNLTFFVT